MRIELGEIEAVLRTHEAIRDAAVVVRTDERGTHGSWAISSEILPTTAEAMRQFLQPKLQDSMIPSAFVVLEALPLTPNGKLDRKALPAPQLRSQTESRRALPATETEKRVAAIWSEFARRGGDRPRRRLLLPGRPLAPGHPGDCLAFAVGWVSSCPLRVLFEDPTLRGLARKEIDELRDGASDAEQPAQVGAAAQRSGDNSGGPGAPLPLSFAQERLWFLQQLDPKAPPTTSRASCACAGLST